MVNKEQKPLNKGQILAKDRGDRLKRIRHLANLSRKALCEQGNLNLYTLQGWEVGRHGGLTRNGAKKILALLTDMGVICSMEWLMDGLGTPPTISTSVHTLAQHKTSTKNMLDDPTCIQHELHYFNQLHPYAINLRVLDDGMSPYYLPGDYVAGIKRPQEKWLTLMNQIVIVELADNEILVRKIRQSPQEHRYDLLCLNADTCLDKPTRYQVDVINLAAVIWHRRCDNL
jgi:transcriptional regulator with XRE-family HTH domain